MKIPQYLFLVEINSKKSVHSVDKQMVIGTISKKSNVEFSKIIDKTYFETTGDLKQYDDLL